MIQEYTKRLRCEVQGCKLHAKYGFGIKGIDYPICEYHFEKLVTEAINIRPDLVPDELKNVTVSVENQANNEPEHEFYECKYCGKKFDKADMTPAQFAAHVKKCKKEHEE